MYEQRTSIDYKKKIHHNNNHHHHHKSAIKNYFNIQYKCASASFPFIPIIITIFCSFKLGR